MLYRRDLAGFVVKATFVDPNFRLARAQRFYQVDTMFAILIVFGVIGVSTDLGLRWLRNATAKWARP